MKRRLASRQISRTALRIADGLFAHSVDFGLWTIMYFAAMSIPQATYGQIWRASRKADRFLDEVNYDVIKNAIQTARKRKWITKVKRRAMPEITEEGRKRLASILPQYDNKRVWDERMYLVTYDIPEEKKKDRGLLREYLKKLGCGMLQESVWLTPYNPTDTLRNFIEEKELTGNIVVSDMGKDGSIGDEDVRAMIVRVYKLEALNDQYTQWLTSVNDFGEIDQLAVVQYLAILKEDPQLPFALLPPWWQGERAYKKVSLKITKVVNLLATAEKLTT